jgi:hypothetical protein
MAATPTPVLTQQEVDMLFSNLEIILNLNSELLKEIKLRMAVWTNSQKIGDVFLKMVSTTYIIINSTRRAKCKLIGVVL